MNKDSGGARTSRFTSNIPNFEEVEQDDATFPKKVERSAFDAPSLDQFLGQLHEETAVGTEKGMPSLSWIKDNFETKSATIRYLGQKGFEAKEIAAHLGLKYQHVYNVLHQNLKRGPNEVYTEQVMQCSHMDAEVLVDVILRKGTRDPDSSRILYRVCSKCAVGLIPGVSDDTVKRYLPGVKS